MQSAIIYPILAAVLYYLGAQAQLSYSLWSRYPSWLDAWAQCPACSGAWYGAIIALVFGQIFHWPFAGLAGETWYTPILVGLVCCYTTPPLAFLHIYTMSLMHSDPEEEEEANADGDQRQA